MKLKVVLFTLLSVFSLSLVAAPMTAPAWQPKAPQNAPAAEAGALVRGGMEALVKFLQSGSAANQQEMAVFLQNNVANRFDFQRMAALVMGRAYYSQSEQRRAQMAQYIQQDFLRVLGAKLAGFQQQSVRFFRPRALGRDRAVVTVGIAQPGGYPARLDFYLQRSADAWKVYDVSANGNSAISYYRQKFAAAWRRQFGR